MEIPTTDPQTVHPGSSSKFELLFYICQIFSSLLWLDNIVIVFHIHVRKSKLPFWSHVKTCRLSCVDGSCDVCGFEKHANLEFMQCPLEVNISKIKYEVYLKHEDADHSVALCVGEEEEYHNQNESADEGELQVEEVDDVQSVVLDDEDLDDETESLKIMPDNNSQYMNCKVKMVNMVTKEKFLKTMLAYFKKSFALHHNTMKWQEFVYRRSMMNVKRGSATLVRFPAFIIMFYFVQAFDSFHK